MKRFAHRCAPSSRTNCGACPPKCVPAPGPATTPNSAARWAAKEAVAKVLVDTGGLEWHDCQVVGGDHGQPHLLMRGSVELAARARGIDTWHVSLSHDGGMAIAFVVAARAGSR